jgi:hypothetical protein
MTAIQPPTRVLSIQDTRFFLDEKPFPYQGVSFFNALFNAEFNRDDNTRAAWLAKFNRYGINVFRIWCQWDSRVGLVDAAPDATMYTPEGGLRPQPLKRLKLLLEEADRRQLVIEVVIFSQESNAHTKLAPAAADAAVAALTSALKPYRNMFLQIWNECSDRVLDHLRTIKSVDPQRLVTNSPGISSELGDDQQNRALDFLTPHTSRNRPNHPHWELAPEQVAELLHKFNKPVVDDEPARNGTINFGGPKQPSFPMDHIIQMFKIWQMGAYTTYHHDMFQIAGDPSVPPSGIPDPEFNPYHKTVFDFIARRARYAPVDPAPPRPLQV